MKKFIAIFLVLGMSTTFFCLVMAYGYGFHQYREARVQPIQYSHYIHVKKNGMVCTDCHTYVNKGAFAGIPPVSKCMECHKNTAVNKPEVIKLTKFWDEKKPIEWKRVHKVPDTGAVYFSHERHYKHFVPVYIRDELLELGLDKEKATELASLYGQDIYLTQAQLEARGVSQMVSQKLASDSKEKMGQRIRDDAVKKTCYQCHGQVEYMGVPRKVAPIKMGWCVQCHITHNAPRDCSTCHK